MGMGEESEEASAKRKKKGKHGIRGELSLKRIGRTAIGGERGRRGKEEEREAEREEEREEADPVWEEEEERKRVVSRYPHASAVHNKNRVEGSCARTRTSERASGRASERANTR